MSDETKPFGFVVGYYEEPDAGSPGAIHRFHERWHEVWPTIEEAVEELREARAKEPLEPWEIFTLGRVASSPGQPA